jgi:hypothetical protein
MGDRGGWEARRGKAVRALTSAISNIVGPNRRQKERAWLVALLRAFAALLAGANGLAPWRFLAFNAAGGDVRVASARSA